MEKLAVVITDKYVEDSDDAKIINSIKACIKFNGFTYFDINFNFRLNDYENKKAAYSDFIQFMIRSQASSANMICCDFSPTHNNLKNLGMCFAHLPGKITSIITSKTDQELKTVLMDLVRIESTITEFDSTEVSKVISKDTSLEEIAKCIMLGIQFDVRNKYTLTLSKSNKYYELVKGAIAGDMHCSNLIEVE